MTAAPAWSLTDAEAVTSSIDLARTVGVPVGVPAIVLAINGADDPARWQRAAAKLAHLPVVTIAAGGGIADAEGDIDALVDAVLNRPHAATVAALLGRHLPADPVEAFHAESLAYATLQAGPEHAAWLAMRGRRVRRDDAPRVRLDGTEPVVLTLTRPRLHNLLDRRGRDELTDAFRTIALLDQKYILDNRDPNLPTNKPIYFKFAKGNQQQQMFQQGAPHQGYQQHGGGVGGQSMQSMAMQNQQQYMQMQQMQQMQQQQQQMQQQQYWQMMAQQQQQQQQFQHLQPGQQFMPPQHFPPPQ